MHRSIGTMPARNTRIHSATATILAALAAMGRWLARKMRESRNRNSLLELTDEQLKDIGLSRGQTESDVHIYSRD